MIRLTNKIVSILMIATLLFSTGFIDTVVTSAASLSAIRAEGTIPPVDGESPEETPVVEATEVPEPTLPPPVVMIEGPNGSYQQLPPMEETNPDPTVDASPEPTEEATLEPTVEATPEYTVEATPEPGLLLPSETPNNPTEEGNLPEPGVETPIPEATPTVELDTTVPLDPTETPPATETPDGHINVTASIEWIGGTDQRPVVGLKLLANGSAVEDKAIATLDGVTSHTWSALPEMDEGGDLIQYTVTEFVRTEDGWQSGAPDGYTVLYAEAGLKVIYTYIEQASLAPSVDITVTPEVTPPTTSELETVDLVADVIWPEGVTEKPDVFLELITLSETPDLNKGQAAKLVKVDKLTNQAKWEKQPKKNVEGQDLLYTVKVVNKKGKMEDPAGFTSTVSGMTVTMAAITPMAVGNCTGSYAPDAGYVITQPSDYSMNGHTQLRRMWVQGGSYYIAVASTHELGSAFVNGVSGGLVETCGLGGSITVGSWSSLPDGLNGNVKDAHWSVYSFNLDDLNLEPSGNLVLVIGIGGGHDLNATFSVVIPPVDLTMTKEWIGGTPTTDVNVFLYRQFSPTPTDIELSSSTGYKLEATSWSQTISVPRHGPDGFTYLYSIVEDPVPDYFDATYSGANYSLTVTNTYNPASLTLVKTVTNDNGGSAKADAWTLSASNSKKTVTGFTGTPEVTNILVPSGSYALSETGPDGYTGTWTCTGADFYTQTAVLIKNGQTVNCTVNNDDNLTGLTLTKTVNNNYGGTAVPANWTLTATGPSTLTGASGVNGVVNPGSYSLTENGPTGYSWVSWSCSGTGISQTGSSSFTIATGGSGECVATNEDNPSYLTLIKVVGNGPAVIDDFTLSAVGPVSSISGLSGTSSVTSASVFAGTYTLSESWVDPINPPAYSDYYSGGAWTCVDKNNQPVVVTADSKVVVATAAEITCKITNSYSSPLADVTAHKVWMPEDLLDTYKVPVTFQLYRYTTDPAVVEAVDTPKTLNAAGNWANTWAGQPKTDGNGYIYSYYVVETSVPTDFTADTVNDLSVTNTYVPPMDVTFTAVKVWDGGYATDHIAVPLTLWRQIEGGIIEQVAATPGITPDPGTAPTSDSYTYTWTGLARTDEYGHPYIYYATEEIYKYYQRVYSDSITDGEGKPYCAAGQTVCTITNIAPNPASLSMIGTKIWQDGPAAKPAVWLQLMQSENGSAAVPYLTPVMLDGTADATCTSGCEKLPWQAIWLNVLTTDNMEKTWTYTVKEVNASGMDWKPENYTKVESGMTVTNTYTPPTLIDPPVAFKVWANFSGPYPTVWMHLYRQIQGGNPQAVGSPVLLDGIVDGDCSVGCEAVAWQARWNGLKATDLQGNVYVYFVKETDASGADWVPSGFTKTEIGMTVTNTYVPGPTPTIIVTIPKTGGGSNMTGYALMTLIALMAFSGMQLAARKKKSK